ncbi:HAD-superfamily hydrolase [Marinobacter santoriniensis NKSG1]|uniref:HAD-superfamily hydrolase n=1 Tax=Marinobacter santoriniensis NKSG1 TaxID=1288826 RepID=M7CNI8_9GAMM|nr:GMP/IMP nucleotidase [Marinobacter santoriniensis]EMP54739.1 HAD-superfamily hydrolase [Marinobacter santoriniensis NKSG1]
MVNWSLVETVFLDMDGTLLDLHFDNHFWLEHLPKRYAEHFDLNPGDARDSLIPMIMAERGSLNWYCTDYWSEKLSVDITALKAEVGDRIGYRPHVTTFLDALRTAGLRSVIVTNCHPDPLALKIQRTGLDRHVDAIVSSHELGRPKEDPVFWQDLQSRTPYEAPRTLMVDDSFPVLESALDAGIGQCLAILSPDSQQPAREGHPDIPGIHHFDEVLPSLRQRSPLPSGR